MFWDKGLTTTCGDERFGFQSGFSLDDKMRKTSLIRLDERGFLVAASGFEPLTLRV